MIKASQASSEEAAEDGKIEEPITEEQSSRYCISTSFQRDVNFLILIVKVCTKSNAKGNGSCFCSVSG